MKDGRARASSAFHIASLKLAKNSAWNLVALFATVGMHFVTVPVVIVRIGLGEFGNAGLVLAIWAPLLLVGTVVGQALTRELGNRAAANDLTGARRMAESAVFIWLVSTVAGCSLLVLVGPALLRLVTGSLVSTRQWRWDLAVAGIGWAAQQGSLMLQGASVAHQNYRTVAWVTVVSAAVSVGAILFLTIAKPDAGGYLAGLTVGLSFGFMLWLVVAHKSGGAPSLRPRAHRIELHCLFSFGKWQGLAQLTGTIANQIDRYVLGAMASAVVIGQYNAAKRPQEAAYSMASKFAEVLFPFFASTARADPGIQARFYLFASWAVMICAAMVLGPAIPLADPIMRIWVGPAVANGGGQLMRTLVLGGLIGCGSNVFAYYLMGVGRNAPMALISLLYSILAITLTILFVHHWGPYAAGVGLVFATIVRVAVSLGVLKHRFLQSIPMGDLITSTAVPLTIGAVLAYAWRMVPIINDISGWGGVAFAYLGISLSIAAAVCVSAALTAFGRSALNGAFGMLQRILSAGAG